MKVPQKVSALEIKKKTIKLNEMNINTKYIKKENKNRKINK